MPSNNILNRLGKEFEKEAAYVLETRLSTLHLNKTAFKEGVSLPINLCKRSALP